MKQAELSRLFQETLDEVARSRFQTDGLDASNETYRYGLGEKERHLATLGFVNSANQALAHRACILDIGCGDGLMALLFQRIGLEVSTIDMTDPPPVGKYGLLLKQTLMQRNINFRKCHLGKDSIPFPDQTFDIVHLGAVIEHLPLGHKQTLDDVKRVLKDSGLLIVDTPNLVHFANRIGFLLGKPVLAPIDQFYNNDGYYGHFREFTLGEVKDILRYSGFKIRSVNMMNVSFLPVLKYQKLTMADRLRYVAVSSLARAVSTFFPGLRYCIWIAAEKVA